MPTLPNYGFEGMQLGERAMANILQQQAEARNKARELGAQLAVHGASLSKLDPRASQEMYTRADMMQPGTASSIVYVPELDENGRPTGRQIPRYANDNNIFARSDKMPLQYANMGIVSQNNSGNGSPSPTLPIPEKYSPMLRQTGYDPNLYGNMLAKWQASQQPMLYPQLPGPYWQFNNIGRRP